MRNSPWRAWAVGMLLSFPAFALDLNEQLINVQIISANSSSVVVLNRGLEDGIMVGTHARLLSSDGHVARGLCLKSNLLTSHWRLYRIVDGTRLSKDISYKLVGMDASEAPSEAKNWRAMDTDELKNMDPRPVDIKPDVSMEAGADPFSKPAAENLVGGVFERDRLQHDLRSVRGNIYASPFSVQKGPNNVQNYAYGGEVGNNGLKYRWVAGIDRMSLRASSNSSDKNIVNDSTTAHATLTILNLSPSWDAYGDLTYRQARYGEVDAPKGQILAAPIGFTWKAAEGKSLKRFEISYAPTYDTRRTSSPTGQKEQSGLRHSFRWNFEAQVSPGFRISNDLRWRPMQDLGSGAIDIGDSLIQEKFEAAWDLVGKLQAVYQIQWMDDAALRRMTRVTRVVTTNTLNMRYEF